MNTRDEKLLQQAQATKERVEANMKTLVLQSVIDRYPRMLGLLKAASLMEHYDTDDREKCPVCKIKDFLKEIEQ